MIMWIVCRNCPLRWKYPKCVACDKKAKMDEYNCMFNWQYFRPSFFLEYYKKRYE